MLVACGTSQVNRSWSAGNSHALMTTFTALSAAPLDCGSPSADVSYSISPVQANSTGLSEESIEGSLSHRNTTLRYPKFSKSLTTIFKHFLAAWEIHSFGRNQVSKNRPPPLPPSTVHHQNGTVSALFNLHLTDPISNPTTRLGSFSRPPVPCGPLTGVSRLDLALAQRPHTTIESLHALSARDPTGSSCVAVLEFHRH